MAVPFSNTKLRVPRGFQNILEGLVREVLRDQPKEIYKYGAEYFAKALKVREDGGVDPASVGAEFEDRFYNNKAFEKEAGDSRPAAAPAQPTGAADQKDAADGTASPTKSARPTEEEEVDIDLTDPDVEQAAVKIQAGFKGLKARKRVRQLKEEGSPIPGQQTSENTEKSGVQEEMRESPRAALGSAAAGEELEMAVEDEEEIDIDLNDPEVAAAAEKIQAGFKGFKARKDMEMRASSKSKTPNSTTVPESEEGETGEVVTGGSPTEPAVSGEVEAAPAPTTEVAAEATPTATDAATAETAPTEAAPTATAAAESEAAPVVAAVAIEEPAAESSQPAAATEEATVAAEDSTDAAPEAITAEAPAADAPTGEAPAPAEEAAPAAEAAAPATSEEAAKPEEQAAASTAVDQPAEEEKKEPTE